MQQNASKNGSKIKNLRLFFVERNRQLFLQLFLFVNISVELSSIFMTFFYKIIGNNIEIVSIEMFYLCIFIHHPSPRHSTTQNNKSGVEASFSFKFGLCLLMRRLSFTRNKKSFLDLSRPIISKSSRLPR